MNNLDQTKIIEHIKLLRTSYNLTQANFAKILNLSFQQVSNLENGRRNLTLEQALLINQIFGVSIDWILGISSTPLTNSSLAFAENKLIKIMLGNFFGYDSYLNEQKRTSEYSLQIRSNIIYLVYSTLLDNFIINIDFLNTQVSKEALDPEFVDMMIDQSTLLDTYSHTIGQDYIDASLYILQKLLSKEKTTPCYQIKQQQ